MGDGAIRACAVPRECNIVLSVCYKSRRRMSATARFKFNIRTRLNHFKRKIKKMASKIIQDLSIDTGTIANIIDFPRNGLKASLCATDYEAERVRKEVEQEKKGEFEEDEKGEGDPGDKDTKGGDSDIVEDSGGAEETATAKGGDEPMESDDIKKSDGDPSIPIKAGGVTKGGDELGGDEMKGGDEAGENDETDEGVEVEEAEVGDELNEGDDPMGDDGEEDSDESEGEGESEGSDESDYDDDSDDDEGVATNAFEVSGVELVNIGRKVKEESDEEESDDDDDQDSDFEEEKPKSDKGFIKVMTLSQSFGVIIQGSKATLSPQTQRKAMSGKYIMIQLKNQPDIPKNSNVVIELQPDVCELFGEEAYSAMQRGDWTKMVQVAKKNGYPYPEILNKMRASQGKAPIKIKQRN